MIPDVIKNTTFFSVYISVPFQRLPFRRKNSLSFSEREVSLESPANALSVFWPWNPISGQKDGGEGPECRASGQAHVDIHVTALNRRTVIGCYLVVSQCDIK